jgi:hypothetical protein
VRKPFASAEAATTALMVLACPSRLGTDTPLSRTVGPHPVGRSSSSSGTSLLPLRPCTLPCDPWGFPVPDLPSCCAMNTWHVLHGLGIAFSAPTLTLDRSPGPPLLGFARVSPFIRLIPERQLPADVATRLRCAGSTRYTSCSVLVDSHHLEGLLRSGLRACCIPVRKGFAAFSGLALIPPASWTRRPSLQSFEQLVSRRIVTAVPRNAVRTLRSIPLVSSRAASLRPLPSCRCRPPHRPVRAEARAFRCSL